MRRPAAVASGVYIFGMATAFFLRLHIITVLIVATCISIVFMCSYFRNRLYWKKIRYGLFFVLFIIGAVQFSFAQNQQGILSNYDGGHLTLNGKVISIEQKDMEYYKAIVKVVEAENIGEVHGEKILVNIYGECPQYYDLQGKNVSFTGILSLPSPQRNPKAFDYRQYLRTKNIFITMAVDSNNYKAEEIPTDIISHYISGVKYTYKCNLYAIFDEKIAGLILGMIFGDSSGLEDELYESFQKNGICHVLAVSGLHIAALYMCVNKLFGGRRNALYNLIVLLVLLVYAALADFSPSVVRAVVMISLHVFSKYMYCKYDMFTGGTITMAAMLFYNPLSLLNLGFQLSFLAIFTLAVVLPAANRLYSNFVTTACIIQAGMAPISAYAFNYFSFSSFVANIPVVFISGILIPLCMLLLLLSILGGFGVFAEVLSILFQVISVMVEFLCKLLLYINDLAFIEKFSFVYVISPLPEILLLYYGVLFFCASESFRICFQRKNYKLIMKILATIVALLLLFGNTFDDSFEEAQMVFVDVGQGDCLHIKTPDGKNIIIDSGGSATKDIGKETLLPYFLKNGVKKIDMAFVTHLHTDHFGGIKTLSKEIDIKKLCVYEANKVIADDIENMTGINQKNFIYLTRGQSIKVCDEVEIQVLYPEKSTDEEYAEMLSAKEDENASSLVMRIVFNNVSVMMTGDIDTKGEQNLMDANMDKINIKTDILKVAHHGSKYSTSEAFVERVSPQVAVIQVGKNNYGHPNQDIIKRLEANGSTVYRNDKHGAVGVEIKRDGSIEIIKMIKEE